MGRGSRPQRNERITGFVQRRAERRSAFATEGRERESIAQTAATLIAEHGIADWALAKRKAARQLGLPERGALPGDDEIEDALREYHALFGGEEHEATLRAQREEALVWMKRLAGFRPLLVGGVAEGWATEHSDIRLELSADDAKAVELALINGGASYRSLPPRSAEAQADLYIETRRGVVRLTVRTREAARRLPRRDRHGREETRLDADALAEVLAQPPADNDTTGDAA
jgi:hypothetical protein